MAREISLCLHKTFLLTKILPRDRLSVIAEVLRRRDPNNIRLEVDLAMQRPVESSAQLN